MPGSGYSSGVSPLPLQTDVIYGPVRSKRLGLSLGINLLPTTKKVCPFDCVYCHYGRTALKSESPKNADFPTPDLVLKRLEEYLKSEREFDYITFSGNGEPMLHPDFDFLVWEVKRLRDKFRPQTPIALLTNSSVVARQKIETGKLIDLPIFKLDCGDEETFLKINRPTPEVKLAGIIKGLKEIAREIKITIQTVFINGRVKNYADEVLNNWISAIIEIKPSFIQIYSVDRPVAEEGVLMLDNSSLFNLAAVIENKTGIKTKAFLP